MTYDLDNENELQAYKTQFQYSLETGGVWELKKKQKTRTNLQNRALHLFYTWISEELNNLGMTFKFAGLKGKDIEIPYTSILIKQTLWRPIQIALFNIYSTKDIDSTQMNKIIDVIIMHFGENYGIQLEFPSEISLAIKKLIEQENKKS